MSAVPIALAYNVNLVLLPAGTAAVDIEPQLAVPAVGCPGW